MVPRRERKPRQPAKPELGLVRTDDLDFDDPNLGKILYERLYGEPEDPKPKGDDRGGHTDQGAKPDAPPA